MSDPSSQPPGRRVGIGFLVVAWVLLIGLLTLWFGDWEEQQNNPNATPHSQRVDGAVEVVLSPNRAGHYVANGRINDTQVTFLLDTGATQVAVPEAVARDAGLQKGYQGWVQTANGRAKAWSTRIDRLQLGDIVLHDVQATITPGMGLDEVLLGMSALGQVDFSQTGGKLKLRQHL
ncbi:TIGR02281 family clan AA aspartic protease [Marinobacteraceae bacterium S3BR75-40.1]